MTLRPTILVAALLASVAASASAQEVTPSTPSIDSRYGSTSPPPDSPAGGRDSALTSRGDPNPTSMGTGHALSEALTHGAPNATPTPGAAPRTTPLMRRHGRRHAASPSVTPPT